MTILDSVLIISESAGGEAQASQTQPHPAVSLKEQEGSVRKHMAEDFAEGALVAIREVREDRRQTY